MIFFIEMPLVMPLREMKSSCFSIGDYSPVKLKSDMNFIVPGIGGLQLKAP
jgi:hypothetical protein